MGWTNSIPIFHEDVTYILQPEIPHTTIPYIDDVPICGPATHYLTEDGSPETHPDNSGIRCFVWEHFQGLNRVVQRMKYCGGTFLGYKAILCAEEITVVGHRLHAWRAITRWVACWESIKLGPLHRCFGRPRVPWHHRSLPHVHSKLRASRKPSHHVNLQEPTIRLRTWADIQDDLRQALIESPALRLIDYTSTSSMTLAVDTSQIAIRFHLCQCSTDNPRKRYYARFGSITLNDRESCFSQPKLELYGLFRSLCALKLYLISVRNLVIEVDARYIKGMLANPDLSPSASINRWILSILTLHFDLVHIPGTMHGPDGLSRHRLQPGDEPEAEDDFDDWIDRLYGFMHFINQSPQLQLPQIHIATFILRNKIVLSVGCLIIPWTSPRWWWTGTNNGCDWWSITTNDNAEWINLDFDDGRTIRGSMTGAAIGNYWATKSEGR